jgi:hypothetical protein
MATRVSQNRGYSPNSDYAHMYVFIVQVRPLPGHAPGPRQQVQPPPQVLLRAQVVLRSSESTTTAGREDCGPHGAEGRYR